MNDSKKRMELSQRVQSIEVGFSILRAFALKKEPMSLRELADVTLLHKSQLYRYLNSFVQLGILIRDEHENPRWSLGHELILLGTAAKEGLEITKQAYPLVIQLNDQLNETVALSVWRERGPFFVHWEKSKKPITIGLNTGSYVPLYTATGRIFRAFLPNDVTNHLYQHEVLSGKIVPDEYDSEIADIRQKRVAVTKSSLISGITSISSPIFYSSEKLAGALSVVGVANEMDVSLDSKTVKELLETAMQISQRIGYY
ncbi:IclR family transcriptional regulator [Brevibacillus nitrificans]|nr:IclR family transcriptional regulator [Brevibacillus nitrificans]